MAVEAAAPLYEWVGNPPVAECREHPMAFNPTCKGCKMASQAMRELVGRLLVAYGG